MVEAGYMLPFLGAIGTVELYVTRLQSFGARFVCAAWLLEFPPSGPKTTNKRTDTETENNNKHKHMLGSI